MRHTFDDLSRSDIEYLIDQWIHKEKYRAILKLRLLDGFTYEEIAEKVDMSDRQIKNIVYKAEDQFFKHSL